MPDAFVDFPAFTVPELPPSCVPRLPLSLTRTLQALVPGFRAATEAYWEAAAAVGFRLLRLLGLSLGLGAGAGRGRCKQTLCRTAGHAGCAHGPACAAPSLPGRLFPTIPQEFGLLPFRAHRIFPTVLHTADDRPSATALQVHARDSMSRGA